MSAQPPVTAPAEPGHRERLLGVLRDRAAAEAREAGRPDLATLLDDQQPDGRRGAVRVVVVGETKRGKSSLVNTLVGRPLLSPVGVDVTTACWLELSYGERDEAWVLLADPESLDAPRRVPIDVREVERYVALSEVADPVVGVEVRLRAPLLRDVVLVDTPGVGGLHAGHSRTTLAALRQADALLFVCDATQPVLAPEVDFLAEAAMLVPTVVVAATKCDVNPDFEVVVAETRVRLAACPPLRDVPVFAVAATLADRAAEIEDDAIAARLVELSGMAPLVASLTRQGAAGEALRRANAARAVANVARLLAAQAAESVAQVSGDPDRERALRSTIDHLAALLADRPQLSIEVHRHLARLRTEPLDAFGSAVAELRARYRSEAERGPSAQLTTLAPRMLADLTAAGIATLEVATEQTTELMRQLLARLGAATIPATVPMLDPRGLRFEVEEPALPPNRAGAGLTRAAEVFNTLSRLIAGAATVASVLTGPGVLAACIALAAGAGWWRMRGHGEQQRRAELRAWVDASTDGATARFDHEMKRRILEVEQYIDGVLPELLAARQRELTEVQSELTELKRAGEDARRAAETERRGRLARLDRLIAESEVLAASDGGWTS